MADKYSIEDAKKDWRKKKQESPQKIHFDGKSSSSQSGSGGSGKSKLKHFEMAPLPFSSTQKPTQIAPLPTRILDRLTVKDSNGRSWLEKGLLGDGVDEGDIAKTILATGEDIRENMWTGAFGLVEGISDAAAMIAPVLLGSDKEKASDFVSKDLYDEKSEVKKALAAAKGIQELYYQGESKGMIGPLDVDRARAIIDEDYKYRTTRLDAESISGEKLDSNAQSAGQLLATSALGMAKLGMAKVPWWLVSGLSAAGGEAESALKDGGATYEEALGSAAISGVAEVLSEKISGGIKFGGKALDEGLVTMLSRNVSNKFLRGAMKFGLDVAGEGAEEVITSLASEFGQWLTYRNDEKLFSEVLFSEQAMDEKIEAFLSGALMGGFSSGSNIVSSKALGVDATSGLTANEEKVVNKIYKDRVAEAAKEGKLSSKDKNRIYDEVVEAMDRGEISVETVEELLGGNSYRDYKIAMDSKEDNEFLRQYDELGTKRGATPSENAQYTEMTERANQIKENRSNLQKRLRQEVSEMVKGDRLSESYNQKALRGVGFKVDLTKVNEKQRAIYQKAMDSGVINDSRRSHEFVDLVAKISSDKGVDFDFTNNERLKKSGFAVEGAQVNGFVNENGITINMQSAKALNKVVGHEVTHVLEGTGLYDALQQAAFDYAKSKGELTNRWKATKALYKDLNSIEINKEITADLVGDYLFGDKDFVKTLYSGNRNVFEKIYDEVKYLCKVVTAGSKEARQLEKVKKAFADAYRMDSTTESGRKYSLAEIVDENQKSYGIGVHLDSTLLDGLSESERVGMVKEYIKELGGESFAAFDPNGKKVSITIAKANEKFKNQRGKVIPINKDLSGKYINNETKQEALVLIDELIASSKFEKNSPAKYPHGNLDNNGKNSWEYWTTYIQDKNNTIWEANLNVANSADGRKILYDVSPIKKVGRSVKSDSLPTQPIIAENQQKSSDSDAVAKEKLGEINVEVDSESGTVSHSLSSLEDAFGVSDSDYLLDNTSNADFVQARAEYVDALARSIALDKDEPTEEERQKAERYLDSLFLIHDMIFDDRERLDYEAAVNKSAWVSNAEYGGSIDFSTLCAKRRLFTGTFDAIQNALPDTVLDENDFLQIRNMLLESDQEAPCSMCYVEGSRAKHGVYVSKWLKEYLKTDPEWKPQIADFTSTTRLEQTRIQHPEAYKAYQDAMNRLSQRKPKEASVRTDYKGEILRDFKDSSNVEEKNKNGGVRFNSFSDFEVIHALDCMQVLTDMARVGLNGQAYTKVKEFAECFGNTGLKINLSLVAKDVDASGKLIMDETNGMKYNEAIDLRSRYSDNVGTVIVVFNEAQLKAALADPSIDYVLPFHRSQWKKSQYTMMGLPAQTKDFTNFQNDRIKNPKTGRDVKLSKIKHTSTFTNEAGESFDITDNIMPNQYWNFDLSGRENAETYLKYINDNGMTPKFSFLLSKDASGKWVLPDDAVGDGYFKLLIDFKMYNNDGWGVPQNPVVPDFNMGFIQQMLSDYKGGHSAFPVANDVVKKFVDSRKNSLSEEAIGPVANKGYSVTSEEVYLDPSAAGIGPVASPARTTTKAESVSNTDELENLSPKDRAKKFFFDEIMSLDKMPEGFRKKHGQKWTALQRATENAQDLVVHGADGVRPMEAIYQDVLETKAFSQFESYMQHLLNMDAMSLNQRFGLKDKDVIGGVTAEMSRQEAAKLEKAHPEFKELAQDVYAYNRYLRNVLVQSGKITQETADLWEQRYPHYIPIKRMGFGDDTKVTDLLSFMIENMEQVPNAENMDGFFKQVENTAPLKARKGSDLPIQPLFDTLTERAMQTYWAAAMNGADMRSFAPVRSDASAQQGKMNAPVGSPTQQAPAKPVTPENVQIETERSSDPKILDVDNEVMRKGEMNPIKWVQEFLLDNGMVFERLAKKIKDRGLEAEWNFIRNARGAAQYLIGNGDQTKGVKSLKDLFAAAEKTGAMDQFYEYLGHQRNLDGMTMSVRFGLPMNKTVMGRSAADSHTAIFNLLEKHPEFKTLAEDTYKYSQNFLDMMVESGMIAQADADMIREAAPHWIPFNVVEGKIQPVFTTLAQETLKVQHQIALNKFGVHLKNTLGTVVSESRMNLSEFMSSIEKGGNLVRFGGNARFHTMTVLDNGKAVTFEITDEMYTALKPTRDILSTAIPVLSHASTLRRNLITAYSPWFTAKNAIRDIQEVVINSQHPVKTYATIPQAIKEIRNKGEFYQEYVKNGGEQNTYFDSESGEFGSGKGVMNALETKTGLKRILSLNNFVEMAPRLAEYIASREAGASVEVAMLDAARVTTNFAAGGKFTKFLNRNGATFLNSSVQGFVQQARNFAEAKQNGFKGWASLAARYAALGLPTVLLNNLIWDDDEEYQELPDYITNNYYIVWKTGQSTFLRIPKGRVAAVIQNAIEQVSAHAKGDEADWREFWRLFGENLAPNNPLEDNIFAPAIQVAMNKTWYDEDLVPKRLQEINDVTQRFDEKTSSLSISLSKKLEDSFLGDHVDLSPKQIHYLLDQYSGVLGDTILPFMTPKAESPSDYGNLIAPVRDIFTTDSVLNNRVTGDFYDTLESVEAQAEEWGASKSVKLQSNILIGYNAEISKLLQKQRDIQTSDLKDSLKYEQNRKLKEQINALQEKALQECKNLKITGLYAEAGDKRYNYDTGDARWYEIKPKKADGTDNWYYQMEQGFLNAFGLSPAEYWNNRETYSAVYKAASHYDEPYFETVKSVLGLESFAEYAVGLSQIYADKDAKGNPISGSKKRKVKEYIYSLNIPDIEKHILYKAEYNYANKGYNRAIRNYVESLDISDLEKSLVLEELGLG